MKTIKSNVWLFLLLSVNGIGQTLTTHAPEYKITMTSFEHTIDEQEEAKFDLNIANVRNQPSIPLNANAKEQTLLSGNLRVLPDLKTGSMLNHPIVVHNGTAREQSLLFISGESMKRDSVSAVNVRTPFLKNRRNVYSALWAYASLNYLYADLVGLMDVHKLTQYQTGVVEGVKITPEFLTVAAGFMQIPIANVFLPHVIKNEKTLRWVQIASGAVMSLVQAGTLFVGKPAPYYTLFSVCEIAATMYITVDAIRWKPQAKKSVPVLD